jgi:cytochrome c biogenesis protein CcdA
VLGLDDHIAELGAGSLVLALIAALLLGLRHATDPDHLTAVAALSLSEGPIGRRRAAGLGLTWGMGHACTLIALGLPVVLLDSYLPDSVQHALEVVVGVVIVILGVRLLVRWRRGTFHVHPHSHGEVVHAHPHAHGGGAEHVLARDPLAHEHSLAHEHPHAEALGRTPLAAFGIGLLLGAGGSAGVGILLVASVPGRAAGAAALAVFALGTALSMAAVSAAFGSIVDRRRLRPRLQTAAPVLGTLSLLFGSWYALGALGAVPYFL